MSQLTDLWWHRFPQRVASVSTLLATNALDGSYLSRRPVLGALAPPAAATVGFLAGVLHPGPTFSRSTVIMVVLAAVGFAGAGLGMASVLAYAVGDLFFHDPVAGVSGVDRWIPLFITYAVLSIVMVLAPSGTTSIRASVRELGSKLPPSSAFALSVAVGAAAAGVLVYAWVRSAAVLIRPVFTWHGAQPSASDISPLQTGRIWWLVGAVVAVTVARTFVEERDKATGDPDHRSRSLAIAIAIAVRAHALGSNQRRRIAEHAAAGIAIAFLLAGMIDGFVQGVLVAAFFTAVLLARDALSRSGLGLIRTLQRVPAILRFAVAFLLARQVVDWIMAQAWESGSTSTFEPLLYGTCAAGAIMTLLSARRPRPELELLADDVARRSG